MAESVQTTPTSLQYRLLKKQIDDLTPVKAARRRNIAKLQRLRRDPETPPVEPTI